VAELTLAINDSPRTPAEKGVMEEGSNRKGWSSMSKVFQTAHTSHVLFSEEPLMGDKCQSILDITDDEAHGGDAPKKIQQSRCKSGKKQGISGHVLTWTKALRGWHLWLYTNNYLY
jgi:hypothetical protein